MRIVEDCKTCETCYWAVTDPSKMSTGVSHGKCVVNPPTLLKMGARTGAYPEITSLLPACSKYRDEAQAIKKSKKNDKPVQVD